MNPGFNLFSLLLLLCFRVITFTYFLAAFALFPLRLASLCVCLFPWSRAVVFSMARAPEWSCGALPGIAALCMVFSLIEVCLFPSLVSRTSLSGLLSLIEVRLFPSLVSRISLQYRGALRSLCPGRYEPRWQK